MIPRLLLSVVSLFLACAARGADDAVIEGRVTLPMPNSLPVIPQRYEVVAMNGIVAINPPLGVVYLEGEFPAAAEPLVVKIEQKDLAFAPSILAVRAGTRVEFPNLDDTFHNVFSFSPTKRFDLGRYRPEDPVPGIVFDKPGLVTLRCEIHQHMRGLLLVLATPHFVTTDMEGRFTLAGLPPGKYVLKAWISSKVTLERSVEITAGGKLQVDFP